MARKLVITLLIIIAWILLFTDYGKKIEESLFLRGARVEKKTAALPVAGEKSQDGKIEQFFPLTKIKVRQYVTTHSSKGTAKFIITRLPKQELKQKITTPLKMDFEPEHGVSNSNIVYVVSESGGIYHFAIQSAKDTEPKIYFPIYYLKEPIQVGTEWKSGHTTGIIESVDDEVTVPAGTFKNCVRVKTTFPNQEKIEWFAPGVGSIKFIYKYPDSSYTTSQLERYE
jgi:hypothetical protein